MLNDSAGWPGGGRGVQYKLAVTRRHKHDSSDFPEDFAQSVTTYIRKDLMNY